MAIAALAGLVNAGLGGWALLAPESFYQRIATFQPYNVHLLHDVGAFQLGIGAALLGALALRDALTVASLGGTVGAPGHVVSHILDRDLGGRAGEPRALGALALLLVLALAVRVREGIRR